MDKRFLFLAINICWLILAPSIYAQEINIPYNTWKETGIPYIQNYSPEDYGAKTQNWAVVQDKRGVMYFGNRDGILEYDGVSWRVITIPNGSTVRSLALDHNGRIYVGAQGEFGYLAPDFLGQMRYISLLDNVSEENRDFVDVWKTYATNHGVYFITYKYLFRVPLLSSPLYSGLEGDTEKIKVWKPETSFHIGFAVRDTLYIIQQKIGLMKMMAADAPEESMASPAKSARFEKGTKFGGDSLRLVADGQRFENERIYVMLPFNDKQILVGTRTLGLFLYDGTSFERFATEADAFLQENQLYHGSILADSTFALATRRGGVVFIDKQGRLRQILNKTSGLRDENVKFVYPDRQGGLWLGFDNGLARVEIPAPLSTYSENLGLMGTVHSIVRHRGTLYASTGQGLYQLFSPSAAGTPPVFRAISGVATQCWSLLSGNNFLMTATNDGVYRIKGNRAISICDLYSYFLFHSRRDTNRVYIGLRDGLAMLQKVNGQWTFSGRFPGITEQVRSIVEDDEGSLWLGTKYQGILRLKIPGQVFPFDREEAAIHIERFNRENGLSEKGVYVYYVNGQVVFATDRGLWRYEPREHSFHRDTTYGKIFADTLRWVFRVVEAPQGRVWMVTGHGNTSEIGVAAPREDGMYTWNSTPFLRMADFGSVQTIYPDPAGTGSDVVWMGGDGGILRCETGITKDYTTNYPALVRQVTINSDSLIFGGTYLVDNSEWSKGSPQNNSGEEYSGQQTLAAPTLDYANNSLRFEFAAPSFDNESANQYRYFLEGFDKSWSSWTKETKKDYTNIPEGDYHFRVKAKNIYNHQSSEAVFTFSILPPWYRSPWLYFIYVLLGGGLIFGLVKIRVRQLERKSHELEKMVSERTAQIVEQRNQLKAQSDKLKELDQLKSRFA
jgi:ligand-binding sensor domain-containing protein